MKKILQLCLIAAVMFVSVEALFPKSYVRIPAGTVERAQAADDPVLKDCMPEAMNFEAVKSGEETVYYMAYDRNNTFMGVVFKAEGQGYSGLIRTMVGMLNDGTISAIKVVSQNETAGVGTRVTGGDFSKQFVKADARTLSGVQAIAGATISSRAVIESVKKRAAEIQELISHGR